MTTPSDVYIDWGPELPARYREDIVVAMVRDPDCLAFYWDARDSALGLVARVKRLTDGVHYDVDLPENLATWHLAGQSNHTYQIELHRRREDGQLELRAASGLVTLPVRHAWEAARKPAEVAEAERLALAEGQRPGAPAAAGAPPTERVAPPETLQAPSHPHLSPRDYATGER